MKKYLLKFAVWLLEILMEEVENSFTTSSALRKKQHLFLLNVSKLINYATTLEGYEITGGELWRTPEQQAIYLKNGKSKATISKHQERLAIDLNIFINGKWINNKEGYEPLAKYWKILHPSNTSGYDWGWDFNHFEMK
jgi:hypothetical protein